MKQHWPAPERNKQPILDVLAPRLPACADAAGAARPLVLEIASGTGQHVVHWGAALPSLDWQPSDVDPDNLASQRAWVDESRFPNVRPPRPIDVTGSDWDLGDPAGLCAVVCCNMIHISPWACAEGLFAGVGRLLPPGGGLFLYGPFRFHGAFTAPSNAAFDESLRARDPRWGVRDVDDLTPLAAAAGLALEEVVAMPANNHTLCFRKG